MGRVKQWRNGAWQDAKIMQWRNNQWVNVEVMQFRNGTWENITTQTYTKTWEATWSQTYRSTGAKRTDYRGGSIMQGDSGEDPWNVQRSLCGFGNMQSTLAGAEITDVKLYLKAKHWWYYAGGTAVIGYHNHATEPTTFSHSKYSAKTQKFNSRSHAQWIDMPNAFGEGIRDGKYKGFSIFANSTSKTYYGEFNGASTSYKPKLKITYKK